MILNRSVFRFTGGMMGKVLKIQFESLKIGDYFYMEESNGEMVVGNLGGVIFKSTGPLHSTINKNGHKTLAVLCDNIC